MKKLAMTVAALAAGVAMAETTGIVSSSVVGYSAKEQAKTAPTGIITFQWDAVGGETVKLNGMVKPSVAGTAFEHGANEDVTTGWYLAAPQIQIRQAAGNYTTRYYADDMWDDTLCTEANDYDPDGDGIAGIAGWGDEAGGYDATTTVGVGGGFWLKQPNGDKKIYVTVKNPVK